MTKCPICNKTGFKGKAGLAQHKRQVHPDPPGKPPEAGMQSSGNEVEIKQLRKQYADFTNFVTNLINSLATQFELELNEIKTVMNDILVNQEKTTDLSKGNPITEKSPNPPLNIDTPWIEAKAKNYIQKDARQDFCINLTNRFAVLQDKQKQPTKVVPGNLQYSDTVKKDTSQPQKYNSWCQSPPPSTQQPISLQPNINAAPQQTNQVQNQPLPCQLLQTHQSDQHPMIQPQYPQPMIQQPPIIPNFNPATQQPLLNHSRNISSQQSFQIRNQQSTASTANQYQNFTNPNHSIITQPQRQNQQTAIDSQQPSLPRYSQQSTVQHKIPTFHGQPGIRFQNPANPNVQQPIKQQPRNHSISSRQSQIRNSNHHQPQPQRSNSQHKLLLLGDSNIHGVPPQKLARKIHKNVFVVRQAISGATASHICHYSEILLKENPDSIIIHAGTNDVHGRNASNLSAEAIACELIRTGVKARNAGVQNIMISSILPIDDIEANEKALEINSHLKDHCKSYNFVYVNNSNLTTGDLYDAVHLTHEGKEVLVNNFAFYMNKY